MQQSIIGRLNQQLEKIQYKLSSFIINDTDEPALVKGKILTAVEALRYFINSCQNLKDEIIINPDVLPIKKQTDSFDNETSFNDTDKILKVTCPSCGYVWIESVQKLFIMDDLPKVKCSHCNHIWYIDLTKSNNNISILNKK